MITDGFIKPNGEEVSVRSSEHKEFAEKWIKEHGESGKWGCFYGNELGTAVDFLIQVIGFSEVKETNNRFHPGEVVYSELATEGDEQKWELLEKYDSEGYVLVEVPYIDLNSNKLRFPLMKYLARRF